MDQKPIDYKAIFEAVKENNRRLHGCSKHFFMSTMSNEELRRAFNGKIVCFNCGGAMDLIKVSEYVRGYIAAGGNPNDVWPGWLNPDMKPDGAPQN